MHERICPTNKPAEFNAFNTVFTLGEHISAAGQFSGLMLAAMGGTMSPDVCEKD